MLAVVVWYLSRFLSLLQQVILMTYLGSGVQQSLLPLSVG